MEFPREIVLPVNAHVVVDEIQPLQGRRVGGDYLRVVGHYRAVVMVVAHFFVEIVGHAGVENRAHALVDERKHVAVHQLGGEAHRVAGNGALALQVQLAAGKGRGDHLEPQPGEQRVPEGEKLVHIQPHGNADFAPGPFLRLVREQLAQLVGVHVQLFAAAGTAGDRLFAPVAADEAPVAAEYVDGEAAVVVAQAAGGYLHLVLKILQIFQRKKGRGPAGPLPGVHRRAVGAHQARNVGAHHVYAHLLLKHPQHSVVQEGAALHHNVPAQLFRAGHADYLVDFTTLTERPAEMSSVVAPSFWACFTEEFMNTVQRLPRSTGCRANRPRLAKS